MGGFLCCCGPRFLSQTKRKPTQPSILYTVIYDSRDHWSILTQRLGSAWPNVLPFCVFNVMLTLLLKAADPSGEKFFLAIQGHKFIQFVVSFLFVTRVTVALGRFNEARGHLEQLYEQSSECQQRFDEKFFGWSPWSNPSQLVRVNPRRSHTVCVHNDRKLPGSKVKGMASRGGFIWALHHPRHRRLFSEAVVFIP